MERLVGDGKGSTGRSRPRADVIITMVPDSPDVEGLALGEGGIYVNIRQGAMHVDMSSIGPDVSARLAEAGKAAGVRVVGRAGERR